MSDSANATAIVQQACAVMTALEDLLAATAALLETPGASAEVRQVVDCLSGAAFDGIADMSDIIAHGPLVERHLEKQEVA